MRLGTEVENLCVMDVVNVGEDTKKLAVDVFGGGWKCGLEFFA